MLSWPITALANEISQLFEILAINLVEPVLNRTINVDDGDELVAHNDGDDNLAPAISVAGDVAGESLHVGDQLGCSCRGRGAADASAKGDGLAGYFALEGA